MRSFCLVHAVARAGAIEAVRTAPDGYEVRIKEPTRNLEQNAKMWAMLTDVSEQVLWPVDGVLQTLIPDDWKDIFTAALNRHQRMAKGIDGGVVMIGGRTSKMRKREMADLIELIYAFGVEHDVKFSD